MPYSANLLRSEFSAALALAAKVVDTKSPIPVLQHVALTGGPSGVLLRATNLEVELGVEMPGSVDGAARTLPLAGLRELDKTASPSGLVTLFAPRDEDDWARANFGTAADELKSFPGADYPFLPGPAEFDGGCELPAADLLRALKAVKHARARDFTRYYLTGVCIQMKADALVFAATDGHRLARYALPLPPASFGALPNEGVIVPADTVDLLVAVLSRKGAPESVELGISSNRVQVTGGGVIVLSKLVDGTFPDFERVIPRQHPLRTTADRKDLLQVLKQAAAKHDRRKVFGCRFVPRDGKWGEIQMFATGPGQDDPAVLAGVAPTSGSVSAEIGFNPKYLIEGLERLDGDRVTIHLGHPSDPVLLTSGGRTEQVVMPKRIFR